jgi:hypothetical protein
MPASFEEHFEVTHMKTGRRVNEADGPASFDLDLSEQGSNGDGGKARVIATPPGVVIIHSN